MSTSPSSDRIPCDLDLYGSCACFYSLCEFLCMYLKEFNDIVVKGMLGELLEDCLLFHVERAGCRPRSVTTRMGCSAVAVQALRNGYRAVVCSASFRSEKSNGKLGLSGISQLSSHRQV